VLTASTFRSNMSTLQPAGGRQGETHVTTRPRTGSWPGEWLTVSNGGQFQDSVQGTLQVGEIIWATRKRESQQSARVSWLGRCMSRSGCSGMSRAAPTLLGFCSQTAVERLQPLPLLTGEMAMPNYGFEFEQRFPTLHHTVCYFSPSCSFMLFIYICFIFIYF